MTAVLLLPLPLLTLRTSPPSVTLVRDRNSVLSLAGVGVILLALLAARRAYR